MSGSLLLLIVAVVGAVIGVIVIERKSASFILLKTSSGQRFLKFPQTPRAGSTNENRERLLNHPSVIERAFAEANEIVQANPKRKPQANTEGDTAFQFTYQESKKLYAYASTQNARLREQHEAEFFTRSSEQ